jgi:translation elongation factor EF-G
MPELRWKSLEQFRGEIIRKISARATKLLTNTNLSRAGPQISEEAKEINRFRENFSRRITSSRVARMDKEIKRGYSINSEIVQANDRILQEIIEGTEKEEKEIIEWIEKETKKLFPFLKKIKEEEKERKRMSKEVKDETGKEREEFEEKFG